MTTRESSDHLGVADLSPADAADESAGNPVGQFSLNSSLPKGSLKRKGFVLLNGLLIFHLFAIIICPASVEPSSPLLQSGFEFVSPYLHMLFLDHGFHFFAPDPGASTLVGYSLEFEDGKTTTGRFPTREISPRLFYHRHFMLTEFLGNGPEEVQPLVERAFARNLCRETGATRVSLTRVVHDTASVDDIRRGLILNDPSLFTETALGTYTAEELRLPFQPKAQESPLNSESQSKPLADSKDIP